MISDHSSLQSEQGNGVIPGPADWVAQLQQPPPIRTIDPRLLDVPRPPTVKVFRTAANLVAPTHRIAQGFQQISFDGEQAIVNREWLKRHRSIGSFLVQHTNGTSVKRDKTKQQKILSKAAQAIIQADLQSGKYDKRKNRVEPPYMAPSTDPALYSSVCFPTPLHPHGAHPLQWCSICNDFGSILMLCCTCRVGICIKSRATTYGCLIRDKKIEDDTFIFYCIFCCWSKRRVCPVCVHVFPPHTGD